MVGAVRTSWLISRACGGPDDGTTRLAATCPTTWDPYGPFITAAGITSALDLTLALVEEDHGADVARRLARTLVTYLQRPGNQAQVSMFVAAPPPEHALVRRAVDHVRAHLDGDLRVAAIAATVGVTERHLGRLFVAELGQGPAAFVRRARVEAAAHVLATTADPVSRVARTCGFGSAEHLRQAFVALYGVPPSRYRAMQRAA